jgi:sulfur carrier protein ThiS
MKIRLRLYGNIGEYGNGKIANDGTVTLLDGVTLNELCDFLQLPEKYGKIFLVNGQPHTKEFMLKDGYEVKVFSLLAGG